jgi:hypothetical protein
LYKKICIKKKYNAKITYKFNKFRKKEMKLSRKVDENSLKLILNDYDIIIVGSDQIWNPSQRKRPEYFLNFGENYKFKKMSYAADSTTDEISLEDLETLKKALVEFAYISVRNEHSFNFVKSITNKDTYIVADPTIIYDFNNNDDKVENKEKYIFSYILGKEINGTHRKALEKIKKNYGNLPVYSAKIPTMNFEISKYADKVFYDLDPSEWIYMIKHATFIYTDSFHAVLFSLKYHKPFLAYYSEKMRATRFIDLGKRYQIEKYIVKSVDEIDKKNGLQVFPDYSIIDNLIKEHKLYSLEFLEKALREA